MGVIPDGGLDRSRFPQFRFGTQIAPKEDIGAITCGNDAENHEDSPKNDRELPVIRIIMIILLLK